MLGIKSRKTIGTGERYQQKETFVIPPFTISLNGTGQGALLRSTSRHPRIDQHRVPARGIFLYFVNADHIHLPIRRQAIYRQRGADDFLPFFLGQQLKARGQPVNLDLAGCQQHKYQTTTQ